MKLDKWKFTTDFDIDIAMIAANASTMIYRHNSLDIEEEFIKAFGFDDVAFINKKTCQQLSFLRKAFSSKSLNEGITDLQVMVAKYNNTIFITFKGSKEKEDWITNFSTSKKALSNSNINVHSGFLNTVSTFIKTLDEISDKPPIDLLIDTLTSASSEINFVITGHSLGGALATLSGAYLHSLGIASERLVVYTFGAPPVGWDDFANAYEEPLNVYRFCNSNDMVPKINTFAKLFPNKMQKYLGSPTQMKHIGKSIELVCTWHEGHEMKDYLNNLHEYKEKLLF